MARKFKDSIAVEFNGPDGGSYRTPRISDEGTYYVVNIILETSAYNKNERWLSLKLKDEGGTTFMVDNIQNYHLPLTAEVDGKTKTWPRYSGQFISEILAVELTKEAFTKFLENGGADLKVRVTHQEGSSMCGARWPLAFERVK